MASKYQYFMNTFFKQIYRYTRPRSYRHNENIWPFCNVTRASTGEIEQLHYKGISVPLLSLTNVYNSFSGDVFIAATGPSIKEINFSRLPTMTALGVNGAYYLKDLLNFQLYIIVDMQFIDQHTDIMRAIIIDPMLILFTTLHGIIRIINYFTMPVIGCQLALIEDACYRIYRPRVPTEKVSFYFRKSPHIHFSSDHPGIAFSTDIRNGVFDAGTVVFWALQILLFLGFTRLYIAGLDMTNFDQPRFYENKNNKSPSFLSKNFSSIIVPAFKLASKVFQENGVTVKNLSLNSALSSKIFEKISFNDVF